MVNTGGKLPSTPERLDDSFFQDPQGFFARLRSSAPVTPVLTPEGVRVWLVTRYEDVRAALADPRLAKDWVAHMTPEDFDINVDPVQAYLDQHMLNLDPPDHTRLRRLVVRAFTPRRVASLRPRISGITGELLDAMVAGPDQTDLIEAFAFPLSVTVICELIGIPVDDRKSFRGWSETLLSARGTREEAREAAVAMHAYFTHLVVERRRSPADDLLSALIAARDSGDSLSENELLSMMFLLLVAGHETMLNLIAGGVLALLTHPAELHRLREDPSLLPSAVEELLRYANPLNHATERFTLEPVTIGDTTIPAKEWVMLASASANRDPSRFPDADRLDVGRDTSGHVGFGHGIHYCLGAPLARLEGEIAFDMLLSRFPALALAVPESSLRWRASSLIHGLEVLPVRVR
ncbi:cytochrome P450 [Streptomyces sp. LBL]|uniref:cytochrome P450 family protein n=1 Tax=Streptomyces sp. LBL TaxID=2940562 RepID=UPI0024732868|nr:cytochrome P450 [Streptomyces sp. LBL]MDH6623193.1 cytochrome P450 [Streptomyces sp. LBL]